MTTRFEQLQNEHQALLERVQQGGPAADKLAEVSAFIEQAKAGAQQIPSLRDRNQLRAILRYWGSWVFEQTSVFPDTTLQPPQMAAEPTFLNLNRRMWLMIGAAGGGLLLLMIVMITLFSQNSGGKPTPKPNPSGPSAALKPTGTDFLAPTDAPMLVSTGTLGAPSSTPVLASGTASSLPSATQTAAVKRTLISPTQVVNAPQPTATLPPPTSGGMPPTPTGLPVSAGGAFEPRIVEPVYGLTAGCENRQLTLTSRGRVRSNRRGAAEAQVQIFEAGNPQLLDSRSLSLDGSPTTMELFNPGQNMTYLVKVDYTAFTVASLVSFPSDCSHNQMTLAYDISELSGSAGSGGSSEANQALGLDWQVINWGPLPGKNQWTATLYISAPGAGQNASYWDLSSDQAVLLADQKLVVTAESCQPANINIGVIAAGETASKFIHLLLWSPKCGGL